MFSKLTLALLLTAPVYAGGFWLQMGSVEASPEATAKKAALIVKATGCHDPATAKVSGVAIQMVAGRRQTTPLQLVPLKEPGTFAVIPNWPQDKPVTLKFIGQNAGAITSMLVKSQGATIEKASAKFYPHTPTPEEELVSLAR